MSRIGKLPISIPADVKVSIDGAVISFAKGSLTHTLDTKENCNFTFDDNGLTFATKSDARADRAF